MSIFETIGNFLGVASKAAPLIGAVTAAASPPEQRQVAKTGFQTLPKEVQDFYLQQYFPAVTAEMSRPAPVLPTRRAAKVGEESFDPIFGSYGLADFQDYLDERAAGTVPSSPTMPMSEAPAPTPDPMPAAAAQPSVGQTALSNALTMYSPKTSGNMRGTPLGQYGYDYAKLQQLQNAPETYTNPYTGTEFNKASALETLGKIASGQQLTPEEMLTNQENIGSLRYDPTPNMLSTLSPLIAGALLAPIGAGIGSAVGAGATGTGAIKSGLSQLVNRARS